MDPAESETETIFLEKLCAETPDSGGLAGCGLRTGITLFLRVNLIAAGRTRRRNRWYGCRQSVDLSSESARLAPARAGNEFNHVVNGVPASFRKIQFALNIYYLRLQKLALPVGSRRQFLFQRIQLRFCLFELLVGHLLGLQK